MSIHSQTSFIREFGLRAGVPDLRHTRHAWSIGLTRDRPAMSSAARLRATSPIGQYLPSILISRLAYELVPRRSTRPGTCRARPVRAGDPAGIRAVALSRRLTTFRARGIEAKERRVPTLSLAHPAGAAPVEARPKHRL